MRQKVQEATNRWQNPIVRTVHGRRANGKSDFEDVASLAISRTERSVMMSKLYGASTRFTGI
jgi:hypothetical protein